MEYFHSEVIPDFENEPRPSLKRTLFDIMETIVLSVVLFIVINTLSARIRVDSFSMEPTLYQGYFVIVNKIAYKVGQVERGDIIVFHYPPNPIEQYIKRVIGLPGDQVHIADGKVYINGVQIAEPYLHVSTLRGGDWIVPENSLFVMGDNRNNSSDSRVWGMVPMANVVGKALMIYWPPEKWGSLSFPSASAASP
jgi:signal peptidase I